MKYFLVLFLLISTPAFAGFYIVNIDNAVIAKCNYQPDIKDLESRNEIAVFIEEDIPLEDAEYRGNKIKKHVKTATEIQAEVDKQKERAKEKLIRDRMKKIAMDELIAEGLISE